MKTAWESTKHVLEAGPRLFGHRLGDPGRSFAVVKGVGFRLWGVYVLGPKLLAL